MSMIDGGREGYAALCAECEDSERNGTRPFRSSYFTMKDKVGEYMN